MTDASVPAPAGPMRFDPVLGMVPDHMSEEEAKEYVAREADIRTAIVNDAMSSEDARAGIENWEREHESRRRDALIQERASEMAGRIRSYIGSYLVFPQDYTRAYRTLLALWDIHTYCHHAQGVTPYLAIVAPTQGAGKSTVLGVLSTIAHNPTGVEVNPTATVVRMFANSGHTLFIDEIDELASDKAFKGVMNSGYKAGGKVTRVGRRSGDEVSNSSNTFCPKAIAGIAREGTLPLPTATLDRCITVKLLKAKRGEITKRFRVDIMRDDPDVREMREWAQEWATRNYRNLRESYFDVPQLSDTRREEIWEPLITIAGLLGEEWYRDACDAARLLDDTTGQNLDPNIALVQDVAKVIGAYREIAPDATSIKVDELVSLRNSMTSRKLAEKLSPEAFIRRMGAFGITASPGRDDELVYRVADESGDLVPAFLDLFARYVD